MLQQLLPQNEVLIPNARTPNKAVECINSYIHDVRCENLTVDISFMNAIDSAYVSTMCSTSHYIKYPEGKINWIVSSKMAIDMTKFLQLGNSSYFLNN
jgi:hypothetical protein